MLSLLKRKKHFTPTKRLIPPRVSFRVRCHKLKKTGFNGFNLLNPKRANRGIVTCPFCNHPYNLKVKANEGVGTMYQIGTNHTFTIEQITDEETVRDF